MKIFINITLLSILTAQEIPDTTIFNESDFDLEQNEDDTSESIIDTSLIIKKNETLSFGYKGLAWGSSIELLDSNSTVPINSNEETNSKTIIGTLGNDSVNYTYFFSDSGFWKVVIQFSKIGEINKIENHISEFHRIEKELSKKYGPPMRTSQNEMGTDREYLFSSFPKLSRAYFRSSWLYEDISIELLLESVQPQISDDIPVFLETSKYLRLYYYNSKYYHTVKKDSLDIFEKTSISDIY
ncbi:MAG: hypothetical protein CMG75_01600 [Candidatus Marinimicrobia bacterium]|nr:hypothetical protein [Candidatus Neomarinimicrobiota bacterium]|tara:strand:+ start:6643 stop:7365 length:723 start_codon:yes stop_codon:yes gene_type:complete